MIYKITEIIVFGNRLLSSTHCIRILAKLNFFSYESGRVVQSQSGEQAGARRTGGLDPRDTQEFVSSWAELTSHFLRCFSGEAFVFLHSLPCLCVSTHFQSAFEPCVRKCLKQVIYFYWCSLILLQPRKIIVTIYYKKCKWHCICPKFEQLPVGTREKQRDKIWWRWQCFSGEAETWTFPLRLLIVFFLALGLRDTTIAMTVIGKIY